MHDRDGLQRHPAEVRLCRTNAMDTGLWLQRHPAELHRWRELVQRDRAGPGADRIEAMRGQTDRMCHRAGPGCDQINVMDAEPVSE